MRNYRAKKSGVNVDALRQRVINWNTTQQVKKHELGLLPNIWSAQNVGMYRQRFYALQGNETGLDQISREQIVRLSRELFFQLPGVGVASELKAQYVCGDHWEFEYKGTNNAWGKAAEKFINEEWFNNCSTKGFAYPFSTLIQVLSRTLDMDGDVLMMFVRNKDNYPLLQFIGSHRIGSMSANMTGKDGTVVVINGKNYQCLDGVVYNDIGKPVFYSIKQDDAQITTWQQDPKVEHKDKLISTENAQLIFNPLVMDKGRGLPALYSSVLYGLQLEDLQNFHMDILKLEATIAYIVQNDQGQAPIEYENLLNQLQGAGTNTLNSIPAIEPTVHGITAVKTPNINYVKSEGGDLKSFHSDRPSEQVQMYERAIETKLLSAIGIPHQIIYSPETISGRAVNAVTQLVRQSVGSRQTVLKRYMKTAVAYALSVAMEEGMIPKNYEEDLSSVIDFTLPPPFRLDDNSDNKINLELYKMGLISAEEFVRENDGSYATTRTNRKREIDEILSDVEETKIKHPEMSEATILNLFTQRGTSTLAITDESVPDKPVEPQ